MRRLVAACVCVVVVACAPTGAEVGPTTTTSVVTTVTTTTTSSTTTTIVAPTTSPSTTTVPESEVPAELLALIGAPMPEVDLTIDGPEDVERWFADFFRWEDWLVANPEHANDEMAFRGEYGASLQKGCERSVAAGVRVLSGGVEVEVLESRFGDVELGFVRAVVRFRRTGSSYVTDWAGEVILSESVAVDRAFTAEVLLERASDDTWGVGEWSVRS